MTFITSQAATAREKAEKERESKREALRRAATASASSRGATASGAAAGDDDVESGDELCSAPAVAGGLPPSAAVEVMSHPA